MARFWWHAIRLFARMCTWSYYSAFRVENAERIPMDGPVLFVVNHPNALVDAGAVLRAVPRPISFAAKDTLFGVPVVGWILRKLGAVPVYRPRDKSGRGRDNLKMFAAFTELFRQGGATVIFPEGTSHLDPELKDVKSGPARLALDSEADADFTLGLQVVPIGLHFEPQQQFRGECHVRVGEPFMVTDLKDMHRRKAIRAVQARIADALRPLVVHLVDVEMEPLVRDIAEVYDDYQRSGGSNLVPRPKAEVVHVAGACLNHFLTCDPGAVELAQNKLRRYQRLSRVAGVESEALAGRARPWRTWFDFVRLLLGLVVGFPFFLFGVLTGYAPYRATDVMAQRGARSEGKVSVPILRMGWGAIFFGVFWGGLTLVAFVWSGSLLFTAGFFAALVLCGLYARFYAERLTAWRARVLGLLPLLRPGIDRVALARDDLLAHVNMLVRRFSDETDVDLLPPRKKKWHQKMPWRSAAAVGLLAFAAWFAWGLRDRDVSELARRASPWSSLGTATAESVLAEDADTLVTVLDTLSRLEKRMYTLKGEFEAGKRVYTKVDDARAVRQCLMTYIQCRETLFRLVWFYRDPERPDASERRRSERAFLLSYAAAIELCRRGMQLVDAFDGARDAVRKLNEGDAAWGLPEGTYDRVRSNLANTKLLEELAAAHARAQTIVIKVVQPPAPTWIRIRDVVSEGGEVVEWLSERLWDYKWDHAVARAKGSIDEGRYALSRFFAELIGAVRVREGRLAHGLISDAQVAWLRTEKLQPGDILLERRNWALSNVMLPGFWTHAALYFGGEQGLEALGIADDPGVAPHLEAIRTPDGHGRSRTVIEALGHGVVLNSLGYSVGEADAVCVLRPRVSKSDVAAAVARAIRHHGKDYDFDFDFFSADRLVCTELVYRAYDGPLDIELTEIMGRKTLPAINLLQKWERERGLEAPQLELVCFLDSDEANDRAVEAGDERLLETLERPGLTVLQKHGGSHKVPRLVLLLCLLFALLAIFFLKKRRS